MRPVRRSGLHPQYGALSGLPLGLYSLRPGAGALPSRFLRCFEAFLYFLPRTGASLEFRHGRDSPNLSTSQLDEQIDSYGGDNDLKQIVSFEELRSIGPELVTFRDVCNWSIMGGARWRASRTRCAAVTNAQTWLGGLPADRRGPLGQS